MEQQTTSPANPFIVNGGNGGTIPATMICFSHLRWDFVYQRPQHLMARFARLMQVYFFEEPVADEGARPRLDVRKTPSGVTVVTPRLPAGLDAAAATSAQRKLLDELCLEHAVRDPILWYYTPMSRAFSEHLRGSALIYDCMDELSAFRFAPPELREQESALLRRADLVFTGGYSLYEAKRKQHPRVYPFPSSVDVSHFATARGAMDDPPDQAAIARPRLGFFGVIDERMDVNLLAAVADMRPDWHLVMVGPVVKIAPADLPRRPNIHFLGGKQYTELPAYLAGWDVALMPFALNESTRFISPTKTPEYLAGGKPVVSTPITDVIRHYGDIEAVRIAKTPEEFVSAIEAALTHNGTPGAWLEAADRLLADTSWDTTWQQMTDLIAKVWASNAKKKLEVAVNGESIKGSQVRRLHRTRVKQRDGFDYMIVGAGFAGSVLAERLAAGAGKRVLLLDRRPHIGGNAYDYYNDAGVLVHLYGPHIFHTNAQHIADYLSRFTKWRPYEHRVLAHTDGLLVPIPINRTTINRLYNLDLSPDEVQAFLAARAEPVGVVRTSEDVVISKVGRELYERFFRGYTRKQWGIDPSELDRSVTSRVPTRTCDDDRYFNDSFQMMPLNGYTRMFENMLDHPNIKIMINTDFREIDADVRYDKLIFTGPVDEYFDYRYGKLPYRSLDFKHETLEQEWFQSVGVVNYPAEDVPYTRITEYKHLTGQQHHKTSISYEYPCDDGDPYYPVPKAENQELYRRYLALAQQTPDVEFVGRLATYRYYNMDQVVAQALATYDKLTGGRKRSGADAANGRVQHDRASGHERRASGLDRRANSRANGHDRASGHDHASVVREYV
ncbi:MAG: UDP-galactopyranose mutase [Gammaproteobacteria bacterium]